MKTRRFGRGGLQVSQVVFGAGYVGGIVVLADDDTRRRVLRRALDAGINWIDTAPLYGQGRSEQALGWLLAEVKEKPYLSTKVRLDLGRLTDIPGEIERSVHESLRRLKRTSVDLLQLHNQIGARTGTGMLGAVAIDDVLRKGGVADGLERMREQGLTRCIGLTALGAAPSIVRALDSGRFDSAQVYYHLLNPSAARAMPAGWAGHDFASVCAASSRTRMKKEGRDRNRGEAHSRGHAHPLRGFAGQPHHGRRPGTRSAQREHRRRLRNGSQHDRRGAPVARAR